jgi:hypothetical protein
MITKASIALAIVAITSVSTLRARQAWGEQQARSSYQVARSLAFADLTRARHLGLLPSELVRLEHSTAKLDGARSPSDSIFWGSQEAFYQRGATAYRKLAARIDRKIERVTSATRNQAAAALSLLASSIARGHQYAVDASAASAALTREKTSFSVSSTPKAFRAILAAVGAARRTEESATNARAIAAAGLQMRAGGTVVGLAQAADAASGPARTELSLISLFSPSGKTLDATLANLTLAIHMQKTALAAAIQEATLLDLVTQVNALMTRVVPAKVILVSTEEQWAHMYENGKEVYNTAVTTGGPELPTDHGVFHIYEKISPFVFHSPWPPGSPYYYPPTPITYWMPFDGGEGLHDASWRSNFGPGSNLAPTYLGTGNFILGTHGCVNLPYDAASFVWNWAPMGTTVVVV